MIFMTLGTYPLPFDRLLIAIDEIYGQGLIYDELFGQIGHTDYVPKYFKYTHIMTKESFDDFFIKADTIISHAGMGTISMALDMNKPLLVIPRLAKYNEVVNDHQLGTAHKFEELGHILVAYQVEELSEKFKQLKTFIPIPRTNQADNVASRVKTFLEELS